MSRLQQESGLEFNQTKIEDLIKEEFVDSYIPTHQLGPDYVLPAESFMSSQPDVPVKLRITETGPTSRKPMSTLTFFEKAVKTHPDAKAMSAKRDGKWIHWSYQEYWQESRIVAKAFLKLGLERFHCVAILGFNAPEWFLSNHGAIFAGGISTGIYTTSSSSACEYILQHSRVNIIVVENEMQLNKILPFKDKLKHLKAIVQYTGIPNHEEVISWKDLLRIGNSVPNEVLQRRIKSLAVNQCCSVIYTSGTTGTPKAVMLCHDNFVYLITEHGDAEYAENPELKGFTLVSYLPLNHITAQLLELYSPFYLCGHVYFAQPDAFKGSLVETLKEVQPNCFAGVPRVYEKMKEKVEEALSVRSWVMRSLVNWSMNIIRHYVKRKIDGDPAAPYGFTVARIIIDLIKRKLGLNQVLHCGCGGASLSKEVHDFFLGLELIITEGYGLSESTGAHAFNPARTYRQLSVGKQTERNEIKLINMDSKGYGEICLRGRNIFMGYMFDEIKTKESLDKDGWLHSGDIGYFDEDGYLFVTGRIKELIITAGGENIAPIPIEDSVKAELPCVSQAVVIGDKRKFLSLLLTLKTNIDLDTMEPLDTLSDVSLQWCNANGSDATTVQDILERPDQKVMDAIQKGINHVNAKAVSNASKIQKWAILPRDFVVEDELSPTLKLKRYIINEKYKKIIDKFYI